MDVKEDVLKNKASIRLNQVKINAIINILSKEGILTHEEVDEEIKDIIKND